MATLQNWGNKKEKKKSNGSCALGDLLKPIIEIQAFFVLFYQNLANLVHFLEKKFLNRWKSDLTGGRIAPKNKEKKEKPTASCMYLLDLVVDCWVFLDLVIYKLTLSLVPILTL
jgi:hypothetical protein